MDNKITAVYFKENKDYHNLFFFFGNDKEQLEKIREATDSDGDVWTLEEYPLIIKKIIKNYKKYWDSNKYFFFRTMYDVDTSVGVPVEDCLEVISMFQQHNKALLYTNSENRYVKLIADGVVRGLFDDITVDSIDVVEFGPDDALNI
jgi:hypothetical protein